MHGNKKMGMDEGEVLHGIMGILISVAATAAAAAAIATLEEVAKSVRWA